LRVCEVTLDTMEINGFKVEIDQDYDPMSPRDDDTPGCGLVMWGRHYSFPNDAGIDIGAYDGWPAIELELIERTAVLVTAPVWVYDHSSIHFKTGPRSYPFDDRWDSAQCGVAYVTREHWASTQGTEWTGSDEQREQALRLIAADVEVYGQYVNGEVYCYAVIDPADGETVDSCSGYYGWEAVTEAAREAAESATHETKCSGELDRRSGQVEHAGPCPLCGCEGS
jgi:hypothetical protein